MLNFNKFIKLDNCVLIESSSQQKQLETHLTHLEDLTIEQGKNGFIKFTNTVNELLKKIQGQESDIEINAKIDGSPALLFGRDPRPDFLNQFFIALKYAVDPSRGVIKEGAKLLHSEKEIQEFYGDRPSFVDKLKTLFTELNRAYDNSGNIYQCDVLYASKEDKKIERVDGEDYIVFKPNVIAYAIPVDPASDLHNQVSDSIVGVSVHESFTAYPKDNYITLRQKGKRVDSIIRSGKNAKVFIMGSNFSQIKVNVDERFITQINLLLNDCREQTSLISDGFDNAYVGSQIMEYLKIYINKQIDLPGSGIFGKKFNDIDVNKFIKGFKLFINKRFEVEIGKKKTDKGRAGQKLKLNNLISFLESNNDSLFSLLKLFSLMIEIKKILLQLVEQISNNLKKAFFVNALGVLIPTKGEGHVIFNGNTHVKIVDRLEFTKINRARGGQR